NFKIKKADYSAKNTSFSRASEIYGIFALAKLLMCLLFCAQIFVPSIATDFPSIKPHPFKISVRFLKEPLIN
ncbi:MAG: hypothetical protein LUC97_00665, partial [Clostridiales bacterium]|nr:hypothetical protein [Clostridiales bacterium]